MKVDGKERKLTAMYAPQQGRQEFFERLGPRITRRSVIGIDANCVPDMAIDLKRASTSPYDNRGADTLRDIVDSKCLHDVVREVVGKEAIFTSHHIVAGGECWSRIDQIYIPNDSQTHFALGPPGDFFIPHEGSEVDHTMVDVRTKLVKPKRGKDLPRIAEEIFDDPAFVHKLREAIVGEALNVNPGKPNGWREGWEKIKILARDTCLAQTKAIKRKKSAAAKCRGKILNRISALVRHGTATREQILYAHDLRKQIKTLNRSTYTLHDTLEKEAYNMGKAHDRCTKEFFTPWHDTHAAQHIEAMKKADWTDPSDPQFTGQTARTLTEVLIELTRYYTSLFADKPVTDRAAYDECLDTLSDPHSRRVLPPTAAKCGAKITTEEMLPVLASLPLGKSPGPDRLPNKFYTTLASTLAPMLTATLNEGAAHGELHPTCIEGIISVLYKKKDREDPRNYRPITLLNGDYKILTRILTRRMNEAVLQFVSPQQNGFVPGGFLPENIMLLKLIQAWVEEEDEEAFFVFLDMEKAFDRSSWQYLHDALRRIGFDDNFVNYVSLFYSHDHPPTRQLSMNGTLGPKFPLHSGVAQGCPLSPLLFLVITEALTRLIMNDTNVQGVTINGIHHKISQYADDSTLIPRDTSDWGLMSGHKTKWCKATQMKENEDKREGQLLGKLNRHRASTD